MTRRLLFSIILTAFALRLPAPVPVSLAIQPFGKISGKTVGWIASYVYQEFNVRVETLPPVALPHEAYYKPRNRYRAEKLLDFLNRETPEKFQFVLGVTDTDISTTKGKYKDWGIFGYALINNRPAVISTFRLSFDNPSIELFQKRLRIIALHEIGHNLGLQHCRTPYCIMEDARGSIKNIDHSTGKFCPACSKKISTFLKRWPETQR